ERSGGVVGLQREHRDLDLGLVARRGVRERRREHERDGRAHFSTAFTVPADASFTSSNAGNSSASASPSPAVTTTSTTALSLPTFFTRARPIRLTPFSSDIAIVFAASAFTFAPETSSTTRSPRATFLSSAAFNFGA